MRGPVSRVGSPTSRASSCILAHPSILSRANSSLKWPIAWISTPAQTARQVNISMASKFTGITGPSVTGHRVANGDYFRKLANFMANGHKHSWERRISWQMVHVEFVEIWLIKHGLVNLLANQIWRPGRALDCIDIKKSECKSQGCQWKIIKKTQNYILW